MDSPDRLDFKRAYQIAEQLHRHRVERAAIGLARRGQFFAFLLAVLFLTTGAGLILLDHDGAGAVVAVTAMLALLTAAIAGRRGILEVLGSDEPAPQPPSVRPPSPSTNAALPNGAQPVPAADDSVQH